MAYPSGYPVDALAGHMAHMNMQPTQRLGETALHSLFGEGNSIFLQSVATGKNLRVYDGEVSGTGDNGPFARFFVRLRQPGVAAFQSEQNSLDWLAIYEGRSIGTGRGGPFCEFRIVELGGGRVLLESTQYPGTRLGFFTDGRIKPPNETTTGEDGQFIPIVHQYASGPPPPPVQDPQQQSMAPQQQSMVSQQQPPPYQPAGYQTAPVGGYATAPPPAAGYPPPGGYGPPGGYYQQAPQGSMMPPPQSSMMPPPQGSMMPPPQGMMPPPQGTMPPPQGMMPPPQGSMMPPPQGSMMPPPQGSMMPPQQGAPPSGPPPYPSGFQVLDAFRPGNVVQLISKLNGNLLAIVNGDVTAKGAFRLNDGSNRWTVSISDNNGVVLQNVNWSGMHVAIRKGTITAKGKNDKYCAFKVAALPDNYVTFESLETPGTFLAFTQPGGPKKAKESTDSSNPDTQFFVRVLRQKHGYYNIVTVTGAPSLFTRIADQTVLQLFSGPPGQERYLSIDGKGNVKTISNGNDDTTFFVWQDHGMGIVSLRSHRFEGFRLQMRNFVVTAKGDPDLNADFRVRENPSNTISFESVTCPGGLLGVDVQGRAVNELFLNAVTIQKYGKSNTITKARIL